MTGEPRPGGPEILELSSVPGFVVFDLPGDRAGQFLRGWWGEPPSPPYAPES